MGKKKPDFQKRKLKVGKQLPKGRNITDTSFKTRQIITPDQRFSDGDKSLVTLLKLLNTRNATIKIDTLNKISNYVKDHKDTLSLCFPDILSKLGKLLLESDPKVTSTAVTVTTTCIKSLSHLQYQSFHESMVLHLNCMMSHGSIKVRIQSLNLLDALLQAHPKVVCKSPKILVNLLDMISTWSREIKCRTLNEIISSSMTSIQWRVHVFTRMKVFLRAMMAQKEKKEDMEDRKEIHWDGKTRLYLPLYMDGLKPATLDYSWYSQMKDLDSMRFQHFVYELIPVLSEVALSVIPNAQQTKMLENEVILSGLVVHYLNTIMDIACLVGEWIHPNLNVKENLRDQKFLKQTQDLVSLLIKNGFPYAQHNINTESRKIHQEQSECSQLNLSICYLYTMCCMDSNEELEKELRDPVQEHLRNLFCASNGICDDSILLILKVSKYIMQSQSVDPAYKNLTLVGMYFIMENYKLSKHYKLLVSFFIELSLDYDFQDLRRTEGMLNWFKVIFQKLDIMMQSGDIDLDFLKYVQQVCARKYPEFIENLRIVNHSDLISLLKCNNEDLQITTVYLIMAMEDMPSSLLHELSRLICSEDSLPEKTSIRLIRLLHTRFSRHEVSTREKLIFVKFLLNTGCDTGSITEPTGDFSETEFFDSVYEVLSHTPYQILPTNKWETHKNIFEVCLECLLAYTDNEFAAQGIAVFFESLLSFQTHQENNLPVHVAFALIRIRNTVGSLLDVQIKTHCYYLMFSCFLYVSVITNDAPDDVGMYCVHELSKCLASFGKEDVIFLIHSCSQIINSFNENEYFYTIKIILFMANRKKIFTNSTFMIHFLEEMNTVASQSRILTPLWNKVCEALN